MGTPLDRGMARYARELVKDLIDLIDQLDDDPDLEPTAGGSCDDQCEPDEGAEPSLGSFDRMTDQSKSWQGFGWEVDAEHDTADAEPSLASCTGLGVPDNQEGWARGSRSDREDDPTESGIGDHDGLLEQVGSQDWTNTVMA